MEWIHNHYCLLHIYMLASHIHLKDYQKQKFQLLFSQLVTYSCLASSPDTLIFSTSHVQLKDQRMPGDEANSYLHNYALRSLTHIYNTHMLVKWTKDNMIITIVVTIPTTTAMPMMARLIVSAGCWYITNWLHFGLQNPPVVGSGKKLSGISAPRCHSRFVDYDNNYSEIVACAILQR